MLNAYSFLNLSPCYQSNGGQVVFDNWGKKKKFTSGKLRQVVAELMVKIQVYKKVQKISLSFY